MTYFLMNDIIISNMDIEEIRRSSIVNGVGYLFLTLFTFITLSSIKGLEVAKELQPAFFVGFTILTIGSFMANREHKYFKACFISFLCLDIVIFAYLIFGKSYNYVKFDEGAFKLASNILTACMNAGLALANGLYVNGVKEVFTKKKDKKMFGYSLGIEYGVTGLLLFSTIQSFIDFGANQMVGIIIEIVLNVFIYLNYAIYMFIIFYSLRKPKEKTSISK